MNTGVCWDVVTVHDQQMEAGSVRLETQHVTITWDRKPDSNHLPACRRRHDDRVCCRLFPEWIHPDAPESTNRPEL